MKHKRLNHKYRNLLIVVAALVLFRALLPQIGLWVVNWGLANKLGNYTGHIEDFDLAIWRGAYQLQKLEIKKKTGNLPPLLEAKEVELQIAWKPLLKGEIAAHVNVDQGNIQLVDSANENKKQITMASSETPNLNPKKGEKPVWKQTLDILIPMRIESLDVQNSAISFTNSDLATPVPIKLTAMEFHAKDLQTRPSSQAEALSPINGRGVFQNDSYIIVKGKYDALSDQTRADLDIQLRDFSMQKANKLLMAYIPLDITEGVLNVYGEIAMAAGQTQGYMNVFLKEADVIAPKQKFISFKHLGVEIISAFANWLLKNNETKKVATHIAFAKKKSKWDIDGSTAFWSAVQNWQDKLKPGLENSVSLKKLEASEKEESLQ